jgi:hypothetical protein
MNSYRMLGKPEGIDAVIDIVVDRRIILKLIFEK